MITISTHSRHKVPQTLSIFPSVWGNQDAMGLLCRKIREMAEQCSAWTGSACGAVLQNPRQSYRITPVEGASALPAHCSLGHASTEGSRMKKIFAVAVIFTSLGLLLGFYLRGHSPTAIAGGGGAPTCSSKNGDVNASGEVDLSDAVTILGNLFLGNPTELVPLCATPPAPSGLPATGQKVCYGFVENQGWVEVPCDGATCAGQDGSYAAGCPLEGRFADNGDGTVTDNCTGLMWQKDTADVNGDGHSTGQDYAVWCDALAYCENLSFAGHDDWRLPNVRELQSIVDYGRFNPSIDLMFGAFSSVYWSSTSFARSTPAFAWYVYFGYGHVSYDARVYAYYVRAVRNAP